MAFFHGEIRMLLSNIPPLYPFTIRPSSALSRGRKNRHGLTFSKRVTPDSSTDSRHFSFHAFSYFYSTVVATRNIAIDVSVKELGGGGGKRGSEAMLFFGNLSRVQEVGISSSTSYIIVGTLTGI